MVAILTLWKDDKNKIIFFWLLFFNFFVQIKNEFKC